MVPPCRCSIACPVFTAHLPVFLSPLLEVWKRRKSCIRTYRQHGELCGMLPTAQAASFPPGAKSGE